MNVRRIFLQLVRIKPINGSRPINVLSDHSCCYHPAVMQKSLLSFFKPLSEKSQINQDVPAKNETKEEKSPKHTSQLKQEKNEKKEHESPQQESKVKQELSAKKKEKKPKTPQRKSKLPAKKSEKKEQKSSQQKLVLSAKKSEKKEQESPQQKSELTAKENEKKEKKSPSPSPEKSVLNEENSPIQKKRKRIIALESDSDGESVPEPEKKKGKGIRISALGSDSDSEHTEETASKRKKEDVASGSTVRKYGRKSKTVVTSKTQKSEDEEASHSEKENAEKSVDEVKEEAATSENDEKEDAVNDEKTKVEPKKKAILTFKKTPKKKEKKSKNEKKKSDTVSKNDSTDKLDIDWKHGEKTPYLSLAKTLQKVEETSSRLKIIDILADYFRNVIMSNKADLLPSIYLCSNTLGPAYEGLELGIADTYLMKAVAQCTGRSFAQIKADAKVVGDLGIVAEQSRSTQKLMFRPAALTVQGVFQQLSNIAKISGQNAIKLKIDKIQALFVSCRDCEARFIIRSLAGKLRIGLAEESVLRALALACTTTPPNQSDPPAVEDASKTMSPTEFKKRCEEELLILRTTYCECPNYNLIVPALLEDGVRELPKHCKITPGLPVKPMLAQPTKGVHEVFQRFENIEFTCEWKYDGERAQIHVLEDGSIKIYSRNQEDNTTKYPDIIDDIRQCFKSEVKSCIIDAEAVAWDREQKKIMPFQILSTRKRKDADVSEIKVRVCVFLFDLLYMNGESLTQKPLAERRNLLKEHFQEVEEKFKFVTSIDTNTMEEVQEFLEESVKGNCEGLMVKTLETEATYEIAKRSRNWLKLKKDYLDGCGDTLDLVVIGGYIGKGKRTGQYGGFLLASYDADTDEYQTICKIGTGFTEEALATHSEFLRKHVIDKAKTYYRYDQSHEPDEWFDAVQVWEIKCADLSLSPIYYSAIGLVDPDKGISLRFPRFLRIREDKTVEQATSSQQVAELYKNQDQIKNSASANESKFNEEDF